ncbi:hypothetical protein N7447_004066 [Penicillium robsamsonii]|uniref:uncharacterized protein n=1 Tax=Penicillium robsamsonii TaxID=1792511 RepID=UPI002548CF1E|nr:uncharacterized protein N7447_004066 [Penicillium robsamsonii]KAJ5827303.1 hypothetical protein N7447_004066 [Penicillium robsamsonii]
MGDAYWPQAEEDIVQRGKSAESIEEITNLIREKKSKIENLGDEAWQKGFEEAQKYLDKYPKLKQKVEDNAETLQKGNLKDLWGLVKESASSGKTEDVEKYITDKVEQAKTSSLGDLDNIIPQLQSLQAIAQKSGSEVEGVLKESVEEIHNVLKKRKEQVEKSAAEEREESK